jgi:hypothetical protein
MPGRFIRAAGFKPETGVVASQDGPPPPPGSQDDVQVRDEGARIRPSRGRQRQRLELLVLDRLPSAGRVAHRPATPELRPPNGPGVHYSGRRVDAPGPRDTRVIAAARLLVPAPAAAAAPLMTDERPNRTETAKPGPQLGIISL